MIKKIITVPDPVLRQVSKPVEKVDKKVLDLVKDLKDTLKSAHDPKGIGISAPQIGILKRVLLIVLKNKVITVINPAIISFSKKKLSQVMPKKKQFMEGCLSVPNYWAFIDRPNIVKVKYLDQNGEPRETEFEGRDSSLFQHEFDHLDGILFIDRALEQKRKIYMAEKSAEGKEELVEVQFEI